MPKEKHTRQIHDHSLSTSPYDPALRDGAARTDAYPHMASRATHSGPPQTTPFVPSVYHGQYYTATYPELNPGAAQYDTNMALAQPDMHWNNTSPYTERVHPSVNSMTRQDVQSNTSSFGASSSDFELQTQATVSHPAYFAPSPTDVSDLSFVDPHLFGPEVAPIPPTPATHSSGAASASTSAGIVLPCQLGGDQCSGSFTMRSNGVQGVVNHLSQCHRILLDDSKLKDCTWTGCHCDGRATRNGHCQQRQPGHAAHVADLAMHIYMTHLDLRFVCARCGKATWKSKQSMTRHRDGHQASSKSAERRPCPGTARVRCSECFQAFDSETLLERHAADTGCGKHIG